MRPNATAPSNAPLRGNFVLLRAGALRLLLPQADIVATEHLDTLLDAKEHDGFLLLPGRQDSHRVAAASDRMILLNAFPRDRFIVTILAGEDVAWAWNDMKVLPGARLQPMPLPPVVLAAEAPVDSCIADDEGIAFLCTGRRFADFALGRRGSHHGD
jgi:hypothetical protein